MRKIILTVIFVTLPLFSYAENVAMQINQQGISKSTAILIRTAKPEGKCDIIYEDDNYQFVSRDYGQRGTQIPGLFVFSKKTNKWMEIKKLSTKDAKLGRSPTEREGLCQVGWDYSALSQADYATIPLKTSGSIDFPDNIIYKRDKGIFLLQFDSSWGIKAVLTQFIVKKSDLDQAFEKQ